MATALAKIEGSSKWGNFKLGPKIELCLRQTVAMQDEWKAKPFTSEPGYGSPAWCAANAYLTLEASSPYFRLREIPGDDVFDEVVCAFAGLEDEVSPILRHFARVCQEGLDDVQQR